MEIYYFDMIKKQWLILLVLILSCSFVCGLTVELTSPNDGMGYIIGSDISIPFRCKVSTTLPNENLDTLRLYTNISDTFVQTGNTYSNPSNNTEIIFNVPVSSLSDGEWYEWNCQANGNVFASSNYMVHVEISNQPPEITPVIPNQARNLSSGAWTLNISDYKTDAIDSGSGLVWSVTGVNDSLLSVSIVGDIVLFTPLVVGSDSMTFALTDSGGLVDTQDLTVTISGEVVETPDTNTAPSCDSVPDQEWFEDDDRTLDLGSYCSDADSDTLSYVNVSGVDDIVLSISGDEITFTPDDDWTGSREIRFNVSDGNSSVLTNTFDLVVSEEDSSSNDDTVTETTSSSVIILTGPSPILSSVDLKVNESKKFKIKLKNSVSSVVYNWYLDEVKIPGAGFKEYDFKHDEEGKYELKVVAKKSSDSDFYMWTVNVKGKVANMAEPVISSDGFGSITGFSIKDVVAGNNKWYLSAGLLVVLVLLFFVIRAKRGKKSDLSFFGKKEFFLKRWRNKLRNMELKRREKKRALKQGNLANLPSDKIRKI